MGEGNRKNQVGLRLQYEAVWSGWEVREAPM